MSNALIQAKAFTLVDHGAGALGTGAAGSASTILHQPSDGWAAWNLGATNGGVITQVSATELKGEYPVPTGSDYVYGVFFLPTGYRSENEVFIKFEAKMPSIKHGLKFMKVFGQDEGGGVANSTFGLDYTGIDNGSLYAVSFGDGTTTSQDTQSIIKLNGASTAGQLGRNSGAASILTPQAAAFGSVDWGTAWHTFKMRVKYNSGTTSENEANDGIFYLEIDGSVYVDATNIWNRHYSNPPIDKLSLFGWSQSGAAAFDMAYRNVEISVGGFI